LEVHVKAQRDDKYQIQLLNIDMPLPVDITADGVTKKYTLDKKGITIVSKTMPIIDPDTYYLKKLIIE
jgi:hypothetical protein